MAGSRFGGGCLCLPGCSLWSYQSDRVRRCNGYLLVSCLCSITRNASALHPSRQNKVVVFSIRGRNGPLLPVSVCDRRQYCSTRSPYIVPIGLLALPPTRRPTATAMRTYYSRARCPSRRTGKSWAWRSSCRPAPKARSSLPWHSRAHRLVGRRVPGNQDEPVGFYVGPSRARLPG